MEIMMVMFMVMGITGMMEVMMVLTSVDSQEKTTANNNLVLKYNQ